ncbi:MAG TPA: hypothetical protein VHW90_03620, partial [Stellaceae bacterium]|nr:hypothetical protein [Stellaceae bacterium]
MLAIFRLLLVVFGCIASLVATARADNGPEALAAVAAARAGDWPLAYARAEQSKDLLAQKVVRWLDYTRASPGGRAAEITAFIDQNPDWPLQKTLRRRAEEAMADESDDIAADWFKQHPPISGAGKLRAAQLLMNHGDAAAGTAAVRAAWVDGDFSLITEQRALAQAGSVLRPEDHQRRFDRLLWDGQTDAARRLLPLLSADYRVLAEARLALASDAGNADAIVSRVPPPLRADPGLVFEQARWQRRRDNYDAAAQLLLSDNNT